MLARSIPLYMYAAVISEMCNNTTIHFLPTLSILLIHVHVISKWTDTSEFKEPQHFLKSFYIAMQMQYQHT